MPKPAIKLESDSSQESKTPPVDTRSFEERLDDTLAPPFCPVRGHDPRARMPKEVLVRRPFLFVAKFALAIVIITAMMYVIAMGFGLLATAFAIVILGLMYAHLVELQHECLHRHAFRSGLLCDIFGFVCGLPMLSSHAHYRHDHLRHHAFIGTEHNREFFNYRLIGLDSLPGFLRAAFHMGRYLDVFQDIWRSLTGGKLMGAGHIAVESSKSDRAIRREYRLYALTIAGAIGYTVYTQDHFFLFAWLLPLIIAEPVHFLIELPEHYGLNTQSDGDVFSNTRTIRAAPVLYWFTNGNNLHTAHHYHQGVPMGQMKKLQPLIEDRIEVVEPSYWSFYRDVITGKIRNNDNNCMTR